MDIRFEIIKKRAKEAINDGYLIQPGDVLGIALQSNGYDWRSTLFELRTEACKLIDKWDIRQVTKLLDLFPFIIPKRFKNGYKLTATMNEKGDWVLIFY